MKFRVFVFCIALMTLFLLLAHATGTVQLSKTGQTISYGTGDDGAIQAGVTWPSPRFVDNADGTVTDNLTGLVWLKNANCTDTVGGIAIVSKLPWADALTWSNALANGACGLSDGSTAGQWRLPNVNELESLVDYSNANPPLPTGHPFTNVILGGYWSSTSAIGSSPPCAYYVDMINGMANYVDKTDLNSNHYVWPVRGVLPPTISGTPPSATVGSSYTFTPTTTNATSFSLTAGTLPPGLGLNTSTGAISGTPTTAGTYSGIQITATGNGGSTSLSGLSITVNKGTPTITTLPTASSITLGQALSSSTLSGGSGSVPGSFTFTSPSTVPGSTGSYSASITFTPTDSADYISVTGTVTVTVAKATPTITTLPTASSITLGQALSSSTLSGGAGSVPGSFAFTNPSTAPDTVGSYSASITFTPTDSADYNSVTGTVTVAVNQLQAAPSITSVSSTTFTVGTAGTFTVTAAGAPSPTISKISGTLPNGVTFTNGVLSGTPATGTAGSYPITIKASNNVSPDATQNFTLTVSGSSPPGPGPTPVPVMDGWWMFPGILAGLGMMARRRKQ
jgi:hypothetical protein